MMINVRELRIGNYVLAHNRNYDAMEVRCVFNIQNDGASIEAQGVCMIDGRLMVAFMDGDKRYVSPSNPCVENCIEPIPITVDILLRCGFICSENNGYYEKYCFKVRAIDNDFFAFVGTDVFGEYRWSEIGIKIRSLHQLQNLYCDVAGEDFIVNLSVDTEEH